MVSLFWFVFGLWIGGIGVWLLSRSNRVTLRRLEHLLPDHLRRESTSLPHRFKRLILSLEDDLIRLHEQLAGADQILESLPVGFLQVDQNNQVLSWNSLALKLLSTQEAGAPVQGDRFVLEMVRSYDLDQLIADVRREGRLCHKEWVLKVVPRDPQSELVESSQSLRGLGFPLAHSQVAVILEDRSEVDDLRQDRDRWTSDVAHEFKTPLTAIRLVSETLEYKVQDDLRPWVQRLQSEVIRLSTLVQDVLELNPRTGLWGEERSTQRFDIAQHIRDAWSNLEPLSEQKDLSFFYDGPDQLEICGPQAGLYRVCLNLLDNAVKHSPRQDMILIRLSQHLPQEGQSIPCDGALQNNCPEQFCPKEPWIELDVIDMGPGIKADVLPHVFKRFYKADESRVRSHLSSVATQEDIHSGTGLGLAIAKEIVLSHQGQISAGNHPELKGAWFQLRIPIR